jgi:hypothetical protein
VDAQPHLMLQVQRPCCLSDFIGLGGLLICWTDGLQIHLVEINIEVDAEIAEAAGVNGTPTIQMFKVVIPHSHG